MADNSNSSTPPNREPTKLRYVNRALHLFSRCNAAVVRATDESALLTELCRIAVEEAGYHLAWVGRAENDEPRTVRLVTHAGPGDWVKQLRVSWAEDEYGHGVAGTAIRTRRFSMARDMQNDPRFDIWLQGEQTLRLGSAIGVPLFVGTDTYGAWIIYALEPDAFDETECKLLEELGANISHGMTVLRAQRRRAEAEQHAARLLERFRQAQAAGHVGTWELDLATRRVWGSEEMFRIYGLPIPPEQTLTNDELEERALPEYRPLLDQAFRALVEGTRGYDIEYAVRCHEGGSEVRFIHSRAQLARGPDGQPLAAIGTMQDITQAKRLEQELLQAQKMESIGRLAGGVAHDFNNLLTVIQSYADVLLADLGPDHPSASDVEEIRTASLRAADLTRQLLAFSRKQVLEPRRVDVNDVISGAERMLRRLIGENVELVVKLAPDLGRVFADRGQLEQVIMNLVVNARDAMSNGGRLTLETRPAELGAARAGDEAKVASGRYVVLSVADTGSGMDAATRERMFEPFFTTKQDKGTGLGLSTVYGIVRQSGGHIDVDTEPGRGTTFRVYLPRLDATAPPSLVPTGTGPKTRNVGTETVLVVEDDDQVRTLVASILGRAGYHVLCAMTPDSALRAVRDHRGIIDLLLTDVVMPGLTGPELAQHLAETNPETRVLFMSGYANSALGPLHGPALLAKPLTPAALLAKVREVLDTPEPTPRLVCAAPRDR